MRGTGAVVLMSILVIVAGWLVVTGWRQPRPTVDQLRSIGSGGPRSTAHDTATDIDLVTRLGEFGMRSALVRRQFDSAAALRIIGRPVATHVGYLVVAAIGGLVLPSLILGVLDAIGVVSLGVLRPGRRLAPRSGRWRRCSCIPQRSPRPTSDGSICATSCRPTST